MKRLCLFWVCCLVFWSVLASAQMVPATTLKGKVTDATTGQPLAFAAVFINETGIGTTTDERGQYQLTNVPLGTVELVASYIGYQPYRHSLRLDNAQSRQINCALTSAGITLGAVTVKAQKDKTWLRQYHQLERDLLGTTPFAKQCSIANPEVLRFTEEAGHLKAEATEPLIIENRALGYHIHYQLQLFDSYNNRVYYGGSTRFDALRPDDEKTARRWERNRQQAYLGSTRHLVTSLIQGNWEGAGFMVYQINPKGLLSTGNLFRDLNRRLLPIQTAQLVQPGRLAFERRLVSAGPLLVFYTKVASRNSPYPEAPYANSEIRLPQGLLETTVDGWITGLNGMETAGYLSADRLATLLPADWKPAMAGPTAVATAFLAPDHRLDSLVKTTQPEGQAPAVFVHLAKPSYVAGDPLWLSAYVLDANSNRLFGQPVALQVDLLDGAGHSIQHQWLRAPAGRTAGRLQLPDTLATGIYTLRAYTEANYGQKGPAFERRLSVFNPKAAQVRKPSEGLGQVDGLPEGGRWVAGLPARLGIKVVGRDGRGYAVRGRVMNAQKETVATFTTNALGMISLPITPQAGQTYQLAIDEPTTSPKPLPPVEREGLTLRVDAAGDTTQVLVDISASEAYREQAVYGLVQQRGTVVHQQKLQLQAGTAQWAIPVASLPAGVCQFTLYDQQGRPWAERLFFGSRNETPTRVEVAIDKPHYSPRETVNLTVQARDTNHSPAASSLSVAVLDADELPADTAEADIRVHTLLTGELRGHVERPGSYFQDQTLATRQALDDLLLTQGWRRVGAVQNSNKVSSSAGIVWSGQVLTEKGEPIPGASLLMASLNPNQSFYRYIQADEQSRFRLADAGLTDTLPVGIQVRSPKGKPLKALIVLDTAGRVWPAVDYRTPNLLGQGLTPKSLESALWRQPNDLNSYATKGARQLQEVTIKARRPDDKRPEAIRQMSLHDQADNTILFSDQSPRYSSLYLMLQGQAAGVNVEVVHLPNDPDEHYQVTMRGSGVVFNDKQKITNPLYIVDGMYIEDPDGRSLLPINPNDIERIEVLKGANAGIYGLRGGNGVVAFYTRRGPAGPSTASIGIQQVTLFGFMTQREFYKPNYTGETANRIDRRDVLDWQPLVQTDPAGRATVAFPLSDGARTIRVVVQGVTADGRPIAGGSLIRVRE